MDDRLRDVYLSEIERQCQHALNAIGALNNVVRRLHDPDTDRGVRTTLMEECFRTLHSFLTHAANVSKILWPGEGGKKPKLRKERASALRNLLELPEPAGGHPLESRTLRNYFEHFDEKLLDWEQTSRNRNIVDNLLGSPNAFTGIEDGDILRCYDPVAKMCWFRGQRFDIEGMAKVLEPLRQQAITGQRGGHERLAYDLRSKYPDIIFDWDQYRNVISGIVFGDNRTARLVSSIHFRPYGKSAEIHLGQEHSFEIDLPPVDIPGPISQLQAVASVIIDAVLHAQP